MTDIVSQDQILESKKPRSALRRWAKRLFLGWVLLSLVIAAANWRNIHTLVTFNPIFFGPDYPAPTSTKQARDQDFDYLTTLTAIDRSFSPGAAREFHAVIDAARADVTASAEEDFLAMAQAVALADNGHTNVSYDPLYRNFASIDVRFAVFADGLFVTEASPDNADLIGTRLLAVDGQPASEIVDALAKYRGGNSVWRRNIVPNFLIVPSVLHAAGLATEPTQIALTLQNGDGETNVVTLTAKNPASEVDTTDWARAPRPADADLAPTIQNWRQPLSRSLPANGYYVRMPAGFRAGDQSIKAYLKDVSTAMPSAPLAYIVADFRGNSGGDYGLSRDFAKTVADRLTEDGTLYLATDKDTFSAAIVLVAIMKEHSAGRAVIIGEPMGDREAFWAERGKSFVLPNSGLYINYATGFHDWAGDCQREKYCFTRNIPHDVAAGSLAPEIELSITYADYVSGTDPVFDYVVAETAQP